MSRAAQPVLVLGAAGRVGRAWVERLAGRAIRHRALDRSACDITRDDHVDRAIDGSFPVVVNCAALAAVDAAERDPARADAINADAAARVAVRCARVGALLVHYSTDYVFGADAGRTVPYRIDDPPQPLSVYGRSKALGEARIRTATAEHLIIRTSWVYASWGGGFVRLAIDRLRGGGELDAMAEQVGSPTSARHLVDVSLALLAAGVRGTAHITDGGACSWYDVAQVVAARTGGVVRPCRAADLPAGAPRPSYSVLDVTGTEAIVGPMPGWRHNLGLALEHMVERR